jgi:anti-sigma-K factor RskA
MPDDKDLLSGEYVLGTLSGEERAAVARRLGTDADLAARVASWEAMLAPLADAVPAATPPPAAWTGIAAALDGEAGDGLAAANVVALSRRLRFWRGATFATGALAACLAAVAVALPLLLTRGDDGQRYLAVVNRDGNLPALIVSVDTDTHMVTVRSVSAEAPANRSYELWYIGGGEAPHSLGTVDRMGEVVNVSMEGMPFDPNATFAITEEPQGGSPTGVATGPMVYSGTLIPDME